MLDYLKQIRKDAMDAFLEKQSETTWVHRHELDELLQEIYLANLELERYR